MRFINYINNNNNYYMVNTFYLLKLNLKNCVNAKYYLYFLNYYFKNISYILLYIRALLLYYCFF